MGAKKKIVVFTGAGVSADSGIATFRDADGLWANYRIEEVCTPEALKNNRAKVIEFYNLRRKESLTKKPNAGHLAIAEMEQWADVCVITQNVDNLHEQAGSTRVVHLHGELMKLRSEADPNLIYEINEGWEHTLDARGEDGALLRPHIVFFGEDVPMFDIASRIVEQADILIVVGTSLAVYPAAALVYFVRDKHVPIYLVDPGTPDTSMIQNSLTHIKERAAAVYYKTIMYMYRFATPKGFLFHPCHANDIEESETLKGEYDNERKIIKAHYEIPNGGACHLYKYGMIIPTTEGEFSNFIAEMSKVEQVYTSEIWKLL